MRRKLFYPLLALYFILNIYEISAQCQNINVNLSGVPDTVWTSPSISRNGQCCGAGNNTDCLSFTVTLDSNTVGVWFYLTGAPALGSEYYQVNCGVTHSMRDTICLTGVGPHVITFCKPGNNPNTYIIEAIAKPTVPSSEITRIGCSKKIQTYGMMPGTITWNSINPDADGAYNSFLSCTDCSSPIVTPSSTAPDSVDYLVCGDPIATMCGFNLRLCDTVRVYFKDALGGTVPGNPFSFCNYGTNPGVTISANASGGDGNYTYNWFDSDSNLVSNSSSYYAIAEDDYILEIKDGLISSTCPSFFTGASVSTGELPIVNAGINKKVCANSPKVQLNGSIQYASGIWSSTGTGTFSPNNTILNPFYTPSSAEINQGFTKLILSSSGSGNCPVQRDTVVIYYSDTIRISINSASLNCNSDSTTISSSVSYGTSPYSYLWNTFETSSSIVDGQGIYYLTVTDSVGCQSTQNYILSAPGTINLVVSSTDVSSPFGSDGTASVSVFGGTPTYAYLWSPGGQTTSSISGLSNGIYQITVTDSKGCTSSSSVVVDDPRCSGFSATVNNYSLNCFGNANGSLAVSTVGGVVPFNYSWFPNVGNSASVNNLTAGTYLVIVEDSLGCFAQATGVVSEPSTLYLTTTHTDATAVGANNGTAQVIANGGTPGYSYSWSNGSTNSFVSGLSPSIYYVTVTDFKGCLKKDSVLIVDPPCNTLIVGVNTTNVSCFGGSTGAASAFVAQGAAPYTFSWSNGGNGTSISNLQAGNYSLLVTDDNNCAELVSFTITQPSKLTISAAATGASCNGNVDGSIELNVSGGTFPYTYTWSNGSLAQDLFAIAPGVYSVTVSDFNGCSTNTSAIVNNPSVLTATYSVTPVACHGATTGSINLTVSGGTPIYSYSWSTGSTIQDIANLSAGYYVVNVTDGNNCKLDKPLVIEIIENDSIKIDSVLVGCTNPSTALANVVVFASGGVQPYQYSYQNGNNYSSPNTFNLPNGNYSIQVRDNYSCVIDSPYNIKVNPLVYVSASTYLKCFDASSDSSFILVTPLGGAGGAYQVSFNSGLSYLDYGVYGDSVSIGSTHYVLIKDSLGCTSASNSFVIPSAFTSSLSDISDYNAFGVTCKGASDGYVQTQISGGVLPYSFSWSNGSLNQNLINIPAGNYTLTITDANSCIETFSVSLSEPEKLLVDAQVTSDFNGSQISCFGASDGVLQAVGSGGAPAYSFSWSNGQNTSIISSVSAGTYTVSITDLNDCSADTFITISAPSALVATASATSFYNGYNISCFGFNDGAAEVSVLGGTGEYSYTWSNGFVIDSISQLMAGVYSVIVKDTNNCSANANITLSQPTKLNAQLQVVSNYQGEDVSCYGSADGSVSVTPSGGVYPYSYSWSNGSTDSLLINLESGWYELYVNDANSCLLRDSIYLSQPDSFFIEVYSNTDFNGFDISCFGYDDGSIGVNFQGGTGLPTFLWSNGSVSPIVNGLSVGDYSLIATDKNGCISYDTISLVQPGNLQSILSVVSNFNGSQISCFGSGDGQAAANVSGGVYPYSYTWSNSQTDSLATNLTAGTYTLLITDANSCFTSSTITLVNPPVINSVISIISNHGGYGISCFGSSDGIVSVNASGGTGNLNYSWFNGSSTSTITGLSAGTYSVQIYDANQCSTSNTVTLIQPSQIQLSFSIDSDFNGSPISCYGAADGELTGIPSGGVGAFTFIWSNGSALPSISNLSSSWYYLMVSDSNQCSKIDSIFLSQPDPIFVSINTLSDYSGYGVSCFGASNGSAMATTNGGVGNVSYLWSNGSVSNVVTGLSSGNYSVTVTDQNGCTDNSIVFITQPSSLSSNVSNLSNYNGYNVSCFGSSDGYVDVIAQGGVSPYSFLWSNLNIGSSVSGLSQGIYHVTITDNNLCVDTLSVYLSQPLEISLQANVTDVLCNAHTDGAIDLMPFGGVSPYTYLWSNGSVSEDINGLPANGYVVFVTDLNNCKDTLNVKVSENKPVLIKAVVSNVKCNGDSTGFIDLTIQGGFPPYQVLWNNNDTVPDIYGLLPGIYTGIVTDFVGCTDTLQFELSQPDILNVNGNVSQYYTGTNVTLPGGSDGYIDLTVAGGIMPYEYSWSNGASTEDLNGLFAGTYTVTVLDSNGCKNVQWFQLSEPFVLEMPTGITPNEDGKNDNFVIRGLEVYPNNEISVFNRWGNIVFETTNYKNDWNGTNDAGDQLPDGTYYVILKINEGEIVLTNYLDLRRK